MYRPQRAIRLGDDFTAFVSECGLDWYRGVITERFESKVKGRSGPGRADGKSMRVLNRMNHWTPVGIEYEADQRHADIIVVELLLGEG